MARCHRPVRMMRTRGARRSLDVVPPEPSHDRLEVVATVLMALAAVATAWASYQVTRWNGEQAKAASRTNALRIDAARVAGLAESQTQVDVATFIGWVDARGTGDAALAEFYVQRFRPEFQPAFEGWLSTDPLTNSAAPPTPFAMDEYKSAARTEVERLDRQSDASSATVIRDIRHAADYVLGVTLFAVALFFAGMGTKFQRRDVRAIMLGVAGAVFVGTLIWVATLPVLVSV